VIRRRVLLLASAGMVTTLVWFRVARAQGRPAALSASGSAKPDPAEPQPSHIGELPSAVGNYAIPVQSRPSGGPTAPVQPSASGAMEASDSADTGSVRILTGLHTVKHSTVPLPSAESPRADGKATLVWFSATWCEVCKSMEPIVAETTPKLAGKVEFVEKSIDEEPELVRRYHIPGTPTFVLIDSRGKEITRFFFDPDPDSFASRVLKAAGV
jgi:thiol-disulfide isomerase/thioredoxin